MTREEAIDILENEKMCVNNETCQREECATCSLVMDKDKILTALDMALSALRPVSREQVERVWRGEWDVSYDEQNGFTYVTCSKCGDETVLNGCFVITEGEPCGLEDFCSVCGAPMTDEAVDILLKRLEALEDD